MRPPLVLLGTHRSGTTLLVRLLRALGLFVGARLEANLEPWFFLRRNEWLLRRAGGAWDRPRPLRELLEDREFFAAAVERFASDVRGRAFREFTGGDRGALDGAWGWKDPRNVFTLDVWSAVFPGARAVHVTRHGVDVAASLLERTTRARARGDSVLRVWPLPNRIKAALSPYDFRNWYGQSARCRTLEGSFELWEESVDEAARALDRHRAAGLETLELSFESLVRAPADELGRVARFAGIDASAEALERATADVLAERGEAFRNDPRLVAFFETVRDRPAMRRRGVRPTEEEA
ncbi:MAG: sulfotransferase [Planctomycetota bacterium JB042]